MTALILAALLAAQCTTGTLSQYAERPTLEVIRNRSVPGRTAYTLPDNWRDYDGLIAVEDCTELGTVYAVQWGSRHARMLAFDCAGDAATRRWMRRNRIVGEVDYYTAKRWHMIGRGMRGAVVCREIAY